MLLSGSALLVTSAAFAAPVTYDFTGTVYSVTTAGISNPSYIGDTVTGTYTFDYAAPVASATGTPGSLTGSWYYAGLPQFGGTSLSLSTGLFSSTGTVLGTSLGYSTPTSLPSSAYVWGNTLEGSGGTNFYSFEQSAGGPLAWFSGLEIIAAGVNGTNPVYDSNGLPTQCNPCNYTSGTALGSWWTNNQTDVVDYNLNSVTLASGSGGGSGSVPEPETYALMLTSLGLLGFAVRRGPRVAA